MTGAKIVPDLEMARIFLDKLEPNGKFTFQTFDDNQDRKDGRLARTLNGTLEEHSRTLIELQKKRCRRIRDHQSNRLNWSKSK